MIEDQSTEIKPDGSNTTNPVSDDKTSKREQRKLEFYLKRKQERRELRKLQKQRRRARRQELQESLGSCAKNQLTETQNAQTENHHHISRKALAHVPRMSESTCQTRVVIDCAYDHMMSFKDICKMANQISKCYAANRRLISPVQLHITGLGKSSDPDSNQTDQQQDSGSVANRIRVIDRLKIVDCDKWDINLHDADYTCLFPADRIVYLCAESQHILPDKFEPSNADESAKDQFFSDDVYVIGGLVDHNSRVGFCYEQAQSRGHRTARLPLQEAQIQIEGRQVLSTVHVFEALAPVLAGLQTWSESLRAAIPARKLR